MQNYVLNLSYVTDILLDTPSLRGVACRQSVYQLLQGGELLLIDQFKLLDEVNKMFERCVEVSLLSQGHNLLHTKCYHNTQQLGEWGP